MTQELSGRGKLYILLVCCAGQFMVTLDVSVVNVALPSIKADLGFSAASLQWVVNAYTLMFAGFLLLGGRATDLLPRRSVFIWGFVLFTGSSLVGGLAPDSLVLTLARGAQGLGAAVLAPATLSILTSTFTEKSERNHAVGAWGATGGVGGAIGMLIGGLLTQLIDWRWVLFVNIPIGVAAVLSAMRFVPRWEPQRSGRALDLAGALSVSAGMVTLVYAIVNVGGYGWGAPTLAPLLAGLALLGVFLTVEGRFARRPLLPLYVFARRQLGVANAVVVLLGFAMLPMWYFVTLYMQQVLHYSPIEAGAAFVPMATVIAACSQAAGRLVNRYGVVVLVVGMVLCAAGMLLFSFMPVHGTFLGSLLLPTLVMAIGIGLALVAGTAAATAAAATHESGLASGLVNTSRQMGGSLGLAILATVAAARTTALGGRVSHAEAVTSGYHLAFLIGAAGAAVGALIALAVGQREQKPVVPSLAQQSESGGVR